MKNLTTSELSTIESSVDQVAKIFFYKERIFRAINNDYVIHVKEMFECGFIDELIRKKLFPRTWISDVSINGYPLTLEHEKISNWNYPHEWSFDMLKDASITVIKVIEIANMYGYYIHDGHSRNVVFNMNTPQYIDLGSFSKKDNVLWSSYTIFYDSFYIPLYLYSKGYSDIARSTFLLTANISEKEFLKIKYPLLGSRFGLKVFEILKILALSSEKKIKDKIDNILKQRIALFLNKTIKNMFTFNKLKNKINKLKKPIEQSMWSDYHTDIYPQESSRFRRIIEIINTMKDANSLIEVASNQGRFASFVLENTHIKKIIATDYDKEAVNIMYLNNKHRPNFLSLLVDFMSPLYRTRDQDIYKRIKSDIVLGLAVTHHLILSQNRSIDFIFTTMKKLTEKYIIIEFMPLGLYSGDINNTPPLPDFYNLAWFKENFINHFELILDEEIAINRHVFVGKIKHTSKQFVNIKTENL